jgi:hypothetical protein
MSVTGAAYSGEGAPGSLSPLMFEISITMPPMALLNKLR